MAKELSLSATLALLFDSKSQGTIASSNLEAFSKIVRHVAQVGALAVEASFKPADITTIDFIFIKPVGSEILVRTEAAGSQYQIPDGGIFIVMDNSADVTDVLITGGSAAAEVELIIAQT